MALEDYGELLTKINNDPPQRDICEIQIKRCQDLIENFTQGELDDALIKTVSNWDNLNNMYPDFLERLLKRGANPNAFIHPCTSPLWMATFKSNAAVKLLLEYGADVKYKIPWRDRMITIIDYIVINAIYERKDVDPKLVKILVRAGAPTELIDSEHELFAQVRYLIKGVVKSEAQKARIRELEADLKEARDYIFELEHRPPELGGPEYERGKVRWQERLGL